MTKPLELQIEEAVSQLSKLLDEMRSTNVNSYPLKAIVLKQWVLRFEENLKILLEFLK